MGKEYKDKISAAGVEITVVSKGDKDDRYCTQKKPRISCRRYKDLASKQEHYRILRVMGANE